MNKQEVFCIFHKLCFDPYHMALSIVVMIACILTVSALVALVLWLVQCAKHTSYCNELAHDNVRDILDMGKRYCIIERRLDELEEKAVKRK